MALAKRIGGARFHQPIPCIVADGLQERITVFVLVPRYQGFLDQLRQQVQDVAPRKRGVRTDGFGGVQRPPGREYGQPREEVFFGSLEQVVAPIDECFEGLLPRHGRPIARN